MLFFKRNLDERDKETNMAESAFRHKENWLSAKVAVLIETFMEHLHTLEECMSECMFVIYQSVCLSLCLTTCVCGVEHASVHMYASCYLFF